MRLPLSAALRLLTRGYRELGVVVDDDREDVAWTDPVLVAVPLGLEGRHELAVEVGLWTLRAA